MTGRARGPGTRARPRILAPGEHMMTEEEAMADQESSSTGSNAGSITGDGNGDTLRGRGGLRTPEQLVTKPPNVESKVGVEGQEIKILANYFRIKAPEDAQVYDYHLDYEPNIELIFERKKLLLQVSSCFGEAYVFDGMSNLKSCQDLDTPFNLETFRSTGQMVLIKVRQVGIISYGCFEMLRMYNTQMRRNLQHIGLSTIGRYYYGADPSKILSEHNGVGIHSGFLTAVNIHDGGVMSVVDTIFKFIRQETVRCYLKRCNDPTNPLWREDAKKELSGTIVLTRFNNKTYRVSDIEFENSPSNQFTSRDGSSITFIDYYRTKHGIEVKDSHQPLLVAADTEKDRRTNEYPPPVFLIPELCYMTGLNDKMRADHAFMRKAAEVTKLKPAVRVAQMKEFIEKVRSNPTIEKEMSNWHLSMEDHLVPLKGRCLQKEFLLTGGGNKSQINQGDFTRELRGKPLYKSIHVERWAILFPIRAENAAAEFRNVILKVGADMGIKFATPRPFKLENDRAASYVAMCKKIPPEAQLIVCLIPNDKKDRYDSIKKFLCIDHPIPSQMITARILVNKQRLMSVCTKIAIQIAAKAGAEPWALDIPPKDIMVIGFDTYHDSSKKGRSAGGFIASMNQTLTKYFSRVHFHENREEMSNSIGMSTARAVMAYTQTNGKPPARIIVYRDGVSDGMIQYVYEIEVNLVKKGILRANEGKPIPLTFIIVTKRINTRFFAVQDGAFVNPPCGTIVDTVVTRATRYDFFLVSQSVGEGTVSPTMFDIICDESGWAPTNHQKLAYKMTHLYFNWSGTVKVPAPCQYAHKLAFLCGQSLHKEPSNKLERSLYFL